MDRINRYRQAFSEGGNLLGLTGVVAASAALLTPLPLMAGLVAEAAYLLFVPDTHWYAARLAQRDEAAVAERRRRLKEETFGLLNAEMQTRFLHLEDIRGQIHAQAQQDKKWFLTVLRKLDYLLEKFLLFAGRETEFRRYLGEVWLEECGKDRRVPPREGSGALVTEVQKSYGREIEETTRLAAQEADLSTKAVLDKRVQVLHQRREGVGKIGRILTNLQYQLALLEDTFGLINDQIRARSPEQVLADIEGVVDQTDSMTQLLEELAPYAQTV